MRDGWGFYWKPYTPPVFIKPDGTVIPHIMHGYCPFVVDPVMRNYALSATRDDEASEEPAVEKQAEEEPKDENGQAVEAEEELKRLPTKAELLKAEATSLRHLLNHMPKNPYCASCQRSKMQAAHTPSRKGKPWKETIAEGFGFLTADHFVTKDDFDQSIDGDKAGIVIKCRGSKWIDIYPTKGKSSVEAEAAFADFEGPWKTVQYFYSDDAPELLSAARARGWTQGTATPGRPETNGIAENAVRQVLEGTRTALEHAGFGPKWWSFAGKHFCIATKT